MVREFERRRRSTGGVRRVIARGLVVALAGLVAGTAVAEVQRVEAVGIYGIRDELRRKVIPRDEAIARARWEAVSRVALELIGEAGLGFEGAPDRFGEAASEPGTSGSGDAGSAEGAILEAALGKDTLPFTRGYRILEDQGERPVLFEDAPGIDTEYVVVVEVVVDVDRVERALIDAGLVLPDARGGTAPVTLEILGLNRFEALARLQANLGADFGAVRVDPLEFERERALVAVQGEFDLGELVRWLEAYSDPRLTLESISADDEARRVRVRGRWWPEPVEDEEGRPIATRR